MIEPNPSTIQLLFTDGIKVTFNTKISKIMDGSYNSIITEYSTTVPSLILPGSKLDTLSNPQQGSVTLQTYPEAPMKSFFYARAYRNESGFDRPVSSIYTNPYFSGEGLGSMGILKHLKNTIGIEGAYQLSVITPDGIEEFAQTLLGVREFKVEELEAEELKNYD